MVQTLFATKLKMSQAWTKTGKRLPVTKLKVDSNIVLGEKQMDRDGYQAFQIGYGTKKLKNMTKPLKTLLNKSGFSFGVKQIREIRVEQTEGENALQVGKTLKMEEVVKVGDIVSVQGTTKGRGFGGVMKRYGFHGGPATHGQSDRQRAPGSIGNRTTPGRVFKGKRMAGHYGNVAMTIKNLQIVEMNPETQEILLSGSVPGHINSVVRLEVKGHREFEGLVREKTQEGVQTAGETTTEAEVTKE